MVHDPDISGTLQQLEWHLKNRDFSASDSQGVAGPLLWRVGIIRQDLRGILQAEGYPLSYRILRVLVDMTWRAKWIAASRDGLEL